MTVTARTIGTGVLLAMLATAAEAQLRLSRSLSEGHVEVGLAGGAPGERGFLVLAETALPSRGPLEALVGLLPGGSAVVPLGKFGPTGTSERCLRLPSAAGTARLFVQGLACSPDGIARRTAGPEWIGAVPPSAPLGRIGGPLSVTKQLLSNFAIDDPSCSTTIFGNERVGMLIPDSFSACDPLCSWYSLKPGAAFYEFSDGRALVVAEVFQRDNPDHGFELRAELWGRLDPGDASYPCNGTPYYNYGPLVQCPQYLSSINTGAWHCYEDTVGVLVGVGEYEGALGLLSEYSAAFQVGMAANDKNLALSVGGWWGVTYVQQPTSGPGLPTASNVLVELFGDLSPVAGSR